MGDSQIFHIRQPIFRYGGPENRFKEPKTVKITKKNSKAVSKFESLHLFHLDFLFPDIIDIITRFILNLFSYLSRRNGFSYSMKNAKLSKTFRDL